MTARSLTWAQVWRRRLGRHHLVGEAAKERMVEVVRATCGVHAQAMPLAEIAIGLRVAGATKEDVRDELWERRGLVKTYGMRGTVHLFPADELPLWLAALRAVRPPSDQREQEPSMQDRSRAHRIVEAIREALDGRCLTREELGEEIRSRVGAWAMEKTVPAFGDMWPRWWVEIGAAAVAGAALFGPPKGNRVTFCRPDEWIGRWEEVDGREALKTVFLRYLSAYGPANPGDFASWFNLDPAQARDLARSLGRQLREVEVEGWRGCLPEADVEEDWPRPGSSVRLLPQFDPYVIGCYPRDRLVPIDLLAHLDESRVKASWARRALGGGSVSTIPTLLVGGTVAGVWERKRQGSSGLEVRVEPFADLTKAQRERLPEEAHRVGEVLGAKKVSFSEGRVEVKPHL
jgi:Winged helix DNA-binding domain